MNYSIIKNIIKILILTTVAILIFLAGSILSLLYGEYGARGPHGEYLFNAYTGITISLIVSVVVTAILAFLFFGLNRFRK